MKEESTPPVPVTESRILFYQSEDGTSRIEVRLEEGTVWLPQALIAELYQTTKQNVSLHIRNIFEEGELQPGCNCQGILDNCHRMANNQSIVA